MDKASMIGTIISRAIADFPYVVHIIYQISEIVTRRNEVKTYKAIRDRLVVMDLYAVVPLLYVRDPFIYYLFFGLNLFYLLEFYT